MPNTSARHETDPRNTGRPFRQVHTHLVQRHALRLPVGECPRQGQRVILSPHMLLHRRGDALAKDRYPIPPRRIIRKEGARFSRLVHAQVHGIELHEHTQRSAQLHLLTVRVAALRPHVSAHEAERAIHQPRLHPQVLRQKHSRRFAKQQLVLNTTEIIGVHLLRLHLLTLGGFRLVVVRAHRDDRLPGLGRQLLQPQLINLNRADRTRHLILAPVHEERRGIELPQVVAPLPRLLQRGPVAARKPSMVSLRPGAVRHAARHVQEPRRVPAIILTPLCGEIFIVVHMAVHLPQENNILEAVPHTHPHANQFARCPGVRRRLITASRLVLTFARVVALSEHRLVADRAGLFRVACQDSVAAGQSSVLSDFAGRAGQGIPNLELDLTQHLPPDHTHLVHDEQPGLVHARLHPSIPPITAVLPRTTVTHRNAEHAVQGRRPELQLERGAASRRRQEAGVTDMLRHFLNHARHRRRLGHRLGSSPAPPPSLRRWPAERLYSGSHLLRRHAQQLRYVPDVSFRARTATGLRRRGARRPLGTRDRPRSHQPTIPLAPGAAAPGPDKGTHRP